MLTGVSARGILNDRYRAVLLSPSGRGAEIGPVARRRCLVGFEVPSGQRDRRGPVSTASRPVAKSFRHLPRSSPSARSDDATLQRCSLARTFWSIWKKRIPKATQGYRNVFQYPSLKIFRDRPKAIRKYEECLAKLPTPPPRSFRRALQLPRPYCSSTCSRTGSPVSRSRKSRPALRYVKSNIFVMGPASSSNDPSPIRPRPQLSSMKRMTDV